ncbi:uncharacterized protein LOC129911289 [Episyrphus balteatus]|uniref:uncharacterized protein LOC129911289 n=1 Tax=Episyrphus balteatus TaxID=286459 RepID=UPI0024857A67|nr:uncharacterized protein LOC129911289 [Episyrphus balteatus]
MEFRELSTYAFKQNTIHGFNLTSSEFNVGLFGSTSDVVLLELRHSSLAPYTFPYAVENLRLSSTRVASEIVPKFDMAQIYLNSNTTQRQYFALDPIFVSELSEDPPKFKPVVLTWSPKNLFQSSILAIVSNNGTCELRRRDTISREWKIEVCNLNQLHLELFPVTVTPKSQTFEKFREAVENTCTTAFSWNMDPTDKRCIFVTANATGWILLFSLTNDGCVRCLTKYTTTLGRISLVYFVKNLIVTCFSNGIVKVFELRGNEIIDVDTLWPNADRISCKQISMSFCEITNRWICVTSKTAHVIVFILSKEGKLLFKNRKYLGSIKITGFDLLSPTEYIFVTITGVVKLIKLNIQKDTIGITEENVKYEYDQANYQILGLVSSPNKIIWTFILYHNKPYKHPSIYSSNDAILSVCSFNGIDVLEMLTNDIDDGSENLIDCAEAIRMEILKDNLSPKYEDISIEDVKITKHYFKKLQLKLLIMNAGISYQRIKLNPVKKVMTNEINSLTKIIESVYINLRLQRLRSLKHLSPFQMLAGKCMKYKLQLLHSELVSKEDVFRNVHENLNTLSDCLLMDLGNKFEDAQENCTYCDKPIDFSTLMCADMHSVPRCSISYLVVPLLSRNFCLSCNRLFIEDIDNLKSIFGDTDVHLRCTFCGFSIYTDMMETFDIKQ